MEASIERERFLAALHIRSDRDRGNEDQVPTVGRYGTGDHDKRMRSEQDVAKLLLARARNPGVEPVWVGNRGRLNEVDSTRVRGESREHMRHRVECLKALVRRQLQDRARGIERTIDGANARTVPTAAKPVRTLAAVPRWPKSRFVQPPRNQFPCAKGWRKRRQV
jgi:hypothetical protein